MRPVDIQQIGETLAIRWEDGAESFYPLTRLRQECPCAGCRGETDIMGNVHRGPQRSLPPSAFQLRVVESVGGYALRPVWGDGHNAGIFTFELLRRLGE